MMTKNKGKNIFNPIPIFVNVNKFTFFSTAAKLSTPGARINWLSALALVKFYSQFYSLKERNSRTLDPSVKVNST